MHIKTIQSLRKLFFGGIMPQTIRKLSKWGTSAGIILPKWLVDQLGWNIEDQMDLVFDLEKKTVLIQKSDTESPNEPTQTN
jgi:hypothetical protein